MNKVKQTKIFISKTSAGKDKFWRGFVLNESDKYYIQTEYWQTKGKHTFSEPTLIVPKNIGKSNETLPKEQAILELASKVKKQEDSGYVQKGSVKKNTRPLPMLAHSFKKRSKDMIFPCYAQFKYDGCRAIYNSGKIYSRKNKDFIAKCVAHLTEPLEDHINKDIFLDGELIKNNSFKESIEAIKKYRPGESEQLKYFVYDLIYDGNTFEERYALLIQLVRIIDNSDIVLAPTVKINDQTELTAFYKKSLELGYEGIILRNAKGLYKIGHRSADLQKYKPLQDDEFEIVDAEEGKGRNKGCVIWSVKTKNNTITRCPQQGTLTESKELFKNYKSFIGKKITVEFQDYTEDGKLRFPTAKAIRNYE